MTIDEAYRLVENLDYSEGLKRKFAPGYSLLQITRDGEIVSVERFKELPTEPQQRAALNRHPGTVQISGRPGMYATVEGLIKRIEDTKWLFDRMKK